ncbi:3288_t:CDS:2 [Cetraspora pellucida]|uniref:3288_t:CDS:1 n=1 Tax=Cetraspora pellucida TaxID=1433469 RepID=A0A9N8ZVW9_9GLOM|nr:3288_t:CDS:2 [Cetraspora pellucida]
MASGAHYGVAKNASIISIKVCNATGSCQYSDIIESLTYIGNQHTNSSNKNTVVNMSLGGGFSQITNNAVEELVKKGVHVVVAAGNSATDACTFSPASAPDAIAVGATNTSTDAIASFSNFGSCVCIFAPGTNIQAAGRQSSTALSSYSGTSQATPHVAGTVALIISYIGNKSPAQMKVELNNLSTKDAVTGNISTSPNRFLRVPYCQK